MKILLNGIGRIGKAVLKIALENKGVLKISCQSDKIQLQRIDNERRDRI